MPEGPEIRLEADRIARVLEGASIEEAWFANATLQQRARALVGCRVSAVETRGKAMLTHFDNGQVLYTHNQLYGRWFVRRRGELPKTARSLRVALHTARGSALLYSASAIELLDDAALGSHRFLARLGPDALSPALDWRTLAARLDAPEFRGRALGSLYLDQRFLAGIGNYLRSEILFFARLAPWRKPRELSRGERGRLARCSLAVTQRAYRTRGVTNPPRRVAALKAAGASRSRYRFAVFARDGRPCYDCGTTIERVTMGSRRLYWCPACQATPT
ncbi:MAG: endonuclease VIII [Gammaproteobacteria bacterium]